MPENEDIHFDAAQEDEDIFQQMFDDSNPGAIEDKTNPGDGDNADNAGSSQENQNTADQHDTDDSDQAGAGDNANDDNDEPGASAKDDPDRIQYWQSRADKAAAELDKLKTQTEQQTPLLKYINENPQLAKKVYDTVQSHLNGDQGSPQDTTGSSVNAPEKPQKPQKPSTYDPVDAVSDPNSDSFKYRASMEDYNEKLVEYNEALVEAQQKRQQQKAQMSQQEQQRQEGLRQLYQEAKYRYNMDENAALDFVKWVQRPDYSTDDLVAVFNARKKGALKNQNKADLINGKNKTVNSPPPPAINGNNVTKQAAKKVDLSDPRQAGEDFMSSIFSQVGGE